jgi:hypothetical protein
MAAKFLDKILFALGAILVVGAFWLAGRYQEEAQITLNKTKGKADVVAYAPLNVKVSPDAVDVWSQPVAQGADPTFVYEVFTSPFLRLYRGEITADPPIPQKPPPPFGVGFQAIKPDLFRVQLLGTQGQDFIFWNVLDNKVVFTRGGMKMPDVDVEILAVSLKPLAVGEVSQVFNRAPTVSVPHAVLLDVKTGQRMEVNSQKRVMTGAPYAVLKVTYGPNKGDAEKGILKPMKAGSTFEENGSTYRIESVSDGESPAIVVTKIMPNGATVTKTLAPPKESRVSPVGSGGDQASLKSSELMTAGFQSAFAIVASGQ